MPTAQVAAIAQALWQGFGYEDLLSLTLSPLILFSSPSLVQATTFHLDQLCDYDYDRLYDYLLVGFQVLRPPLDLKDRALGLLVRLDRLVDRLPAEAHQISLLSQDPYILAFALRQVRAFVEGVRFEALGGGARKAHGLDLRIDATRSRGFRSRNG